MTILLAGSLALTNWKFFTEASFTLPRKFRHQQRSVSFQCGGLFLRTTLGDCGAFLLEVDDSVWTGLDADRHTLFDL